ncbi:MAG TPA: FkbM family methyltransferase [Polyangiaceae bacterium]|nr:FkbM family methyltransferase [Polyangiaceae bacterium]
MTWLSYSQNGEDVRLKRAFAEQGTGFYIDVGANHPVDNSVTKHFYDCGWTGINVDPAPHPFRLISKDRSRDINLNVGCSNKQGTLKLHAARGDASGLSTFTVEEADIHRAKGFEFDTIDARLTTLADICAEHVAGRQIDFMSIDVEGHEREVLEGADFARFRPRVILVEATRPNTTEPTHDRWEDLILRHDYRFAVFDGLNRFYVRREDEPLIPILALAPNFFDQFVPYVYQRQIDGLRAEVIAYRTVNPALLLIAPIARGIGKLARWMAPGLARG